MHMALEVDWKAWDLRLGVLERNFRRVIMYIWLMFVRVLVPAYLDCLG